RSRTRGSPATRTSSGARVGNGRGCDPAEEPRLRGDARSADAAAAPRLRTRHGRTATRLATDRSTHVGLSGTSTHWTANQNGGRPSGIGTDAVLPNTTGVIAKSRPMLVGVVHASGDGRGTVCSAGNARPSRMNWLWIEGGASNRSVPPGFAPPEMDTTAAPGLPLPGTESS